MAEFSFFLPQLLKFEGGYVDDPSDPGGMTNLGITMNTFRSAAPSILGIPATSQNLKNLTPDQAGKIYESMYWDKVAGDQIEPQELADIVCDFYVNSGNHATKLLQSVLNGMNGGKALQVDGIIGPGTLDALSSVDAKEVYRRYKAGRAQYYRDLVSSNPHLSKFLKGWLNRVNSFPDP